MENTIENKERFFAQYYNQNVMLQPATDNSLSKVDCENMHRWLHECVLELKPLSQITDEDAREIFKICDLGHLTPVGSAAISLANTILTNLDIQGNILKWMEILDFMRLKGFIMPYNGLSTETLIQYGWVRVKE